jgi:hypothetical protein
MFDINKLCTPAYVYLVISALSMVILILQNAAGKNNIYCVGDYECEVPNTAAVFIAKGLYIALWTFILNSLCNAGYKNFAWFVLFLPIIFLFVMIGLLMLHYGVKSRKDSGFIKYG